MEKKRGVVVVLLQVFCLLAGFGLALGAMELPDNLKEVPLYSESKIVETMDMGNSSMAALKVKADRDAVLDFYRRNMKAKGWKVAFQAEQEDSAMVHFTKDKQMIQLHVESEDEEGMVQYRLVFAESN